MSVYIYYPREKFQVQFQYSRIRPFGLVDQTVLQLLREGCTLGRVAELLGLPPRMVVESAFELLRANMLVVTSESLGLSDQGRRWADKLREYPRAQVQTGRANIFYDWNLGGMDVSLKLEEEDDEEADTGGLEICGLFVTKKSGKPGRIQPWTNSGTNSDKEAPTELVQLGAKSYSPLEWEEKVKSSLSPNIENLRPSLSALALSSLRSALKKNDLILLDMEPLVLYTCYRFGYKLAPQAEGKAEACGKEIPNVRIPREDWLLSAEAHCQWLRQAMQKANAHLLVFSAHQSAGALKNIERDFRATRGDSFLILGYAETDGCAKPKVEKLTHLVAENAGSDMKLAVYDDQDGNVHLTLGSFNWMQSYYPQVDVDSRIGPELDGSGRDGPGLEISLVLHSERQAPAIRDVLEQMRVQVSAYPDSVEKSKLLVAFGRLKALLDEKIQATKSAGAVGLAESAGPESHAEGMVIINSAITNEYGQALLHAERRCLVLSHSLSAQLAPLRLLNDRSWPFQSSCFIAFSELYPEHKTGPGDRAVATEREIAEYLENARPKGDPGVLIRNVPGLHARLIVNDDTVTVSSLNCLSARAAVHSAFGLRFRDPDSARMLEEFFAQNYGANKAAASSEDLASLLQAIKASDDSDALDLLKNFVGKN